MSKSDYIVYFTQTGSNSDFQALSPNICNTNLSETSDVIQTKLPLIPRPLQWVQMLCVLGRNIRTQLFFYGYTYIADTSILQYIYLASKLRDAFRIHRYKNEIVVCLAGLSPSSWGKDKEKIEKT